MAADLLGFGLVRPFRRDLKSDFASAGGEALVKSAVGQILGTMASSDFTEGELPWRTEFGSLLHLLRHQPNSDLLGELARVYVVDALGRWEPRIHVTAVSATREAANVLAVRVRYRLAIANKAGNQVVGAEAEVTVRV